MHSSVYENNQIRYNCLNISMSWHARPRGTHAIITTPVHVYTEIKFKFAHSAKHCIDKLRS